MRSAIEIVDCASGEPVQAERFDGVTVEHFLETHNEWRPVVLEVARHMVASGAPGEVIPKHFHRDWCNKERDLRMLAFTFFGIECGGKLQGLMKLESAGQVGGLHRRRGSLCCMLINWRRPRGTLKR